jgi:hypothetical protein
MQQPSGLFVCEITFTAFGLYFGKDCKGYLSKKTAKQESAYAAVSYLRAQGLISPYADKRIKNMN